MEYHHRMEVSALIISKDMAALAVLRRAMLSVGVSVETCGAIVSARNAMGARKFDGIVVDCDDLEGGLDLLRSLRAQDATKSAIIFAMIEATTSMQMVFQLGANFVMEKPLAFDRIVRCLRAAQGLMIGERRRYYRHKVDFAVYLNLGGNASNLAVTSIELSSGGVAIATAEQLAIGKQGSLRFALPDSNDIVETTCEVVWIQRGRVGFKFSQLSKAAKLALDSWLAERFEYSRALDGGRPSSLDPPL